jgi:hypothetical protein
MPFLSRSRFSTCLSFPCAAMSALRKLRQLKQQQAEAPAASAASAAAVPEEDEPVVAARPVANAFDMLAQSDDEEEAEAEKTEAATEQQQTQEAAKTARDSAAADDKPADELAAAGPDAPAAPTVAKPKSKKQPKAATAAAAGGGGGKKKKGTAAAAAAAPEKEDWELEFGTPAAASSSPSASPAAAAAASASNLWDVLRSEPRHLDAQAEIRAVFGSGIGGRGGGGTAAADDEDAAANRQMQGGRNQGGFRRGGAAMVRRVRATAGGSSGAGSSSSSSSSRMLVRPSPSWSRAESSGLLKAQYVAPMTEPPTPPAATAGNKAAKSKASGVHGNIHSLADSAAASSASSAAAAAASSSDAAAAASAMEQQREKEAQQAQADYAAALQRWQRQSQLVLGPGVRQYTFVHTGEFRHQQEDYAYAVATHDVQQLALFSRRHPFHPDAALSMAEIFTSQSEFATAAELVSRALYVHEQAWQGTEMADKLRQGLARIDASIPENTSFFTALARHAQALGKRGCPRTALEVCKLLLSLSPLLDPQSVLLSIDFYALRAKQFEWLRDFANHLDQAIISAYGVGQHPWAAHPSAATTTAAAAASSAPGSNIATLSSPAAVAAASSSSAAAALLSPPPRAPATFLPNLMYSRALAVFHMENAAATGTGDDKKRKGAAAVASTSTSGTAATAASVVFTGAVQPPTLPTTAAGHSMLDADEAAALAAAAAEDAPSSSSITSSYLLQQAMLMWPSVIGPLLAGAGAESALARPAWVAALSALNDLYPSSSSAYLDKLQLCFVERSASLWKNDRIQAWLLSNAQQLATALAAKPSTVYSPSLLLRFAAARERYLLSIPIPPVVRALQKSAYSDHVAHLPPELLLAQQHAGMEQWGVGERRRQYEADLAANGMRALDVAHQNPLRAFIQSLLPWFAAPLDGVGAGGGAAAAAAAAGGAAGDVDAQMAAIERQLAALPADQQQELLRVLNVEQGEEDEEEQPEDEPQPQGGGGGDYADYEFDD